MPIDPNCEECRGRGFVELAFSRPTCNTCNAAPVVADVTGLASLTPPGAYESNITTGRVASDRPALANYPRGDVGLSIAATALEGELALERGSAAHGRFMSATRRLYSAIRQCGRSWVAFHQACATLAIGARAIGEALAYSADRSAVEPSYHTLLGAVFHALQIANTQAERADARRRATGVGSAWYGVNFSRAERASWRVHVARQGRPDEHVPVLVDHKTAAENTIRSWASKTSDEILADLANLIARLPALADVTRRHAVPGTWRERNFADERPQHGTGEHHRALVGVVDRAPRMVANTPANQATIADAINRAIHRTLDELGVVGPVSFDVTITV